MNLLISTKNNCLQVAELGESITYGREICHGNSGILDIKRISLEGHQHLIIVRQNGTIQLYKYYKHLQDYQVVKEWRNGVIDSSDHIVSIGIAGERFLYSCSVEGIFTIRDLVNDDDDDSFKEYKLQSPVTCVKAIEKNGEINVVVGGKDSGLRYYNFLLSKTCDIEEDLPKLCNITPNTSVGSLSQLRYLLRRNKDIFSKQKLDPTWKAPIYFETYWVVSLEFWQNYIVCGTQFGFVFIYDKIKESKPLKVLKVASSPIINLTVVGHYLIYTDMMSKVGIISLKTLREINSFNHNFGVVEYNKILVSKSKLRPMIVVASTTEGRLKAVKLHPNNLCEVIYDCELETVSQSFIPLTKTS